MAFAGIGCPVGIIRGTTATHGEPRNFRVDIEPPPELYPNSPKFFPVIQLPDVYN